MNTKLYKEVQQLAAELLAAAEADNELVFQQLYQQLQQLCTDNEADEHRNHPVQWETLADFTEDYDEALRIYEKALTVSNARKTRDYNASIQYAMALLLNDMNRKEEALARVSSAKASANKIEDAELQREIAQLYKKLS